ncbi:hypothetical protein Gogos_021452 [Gossypium gossypioides]|uniref:pectinesterase n=1 Tax=Gossypium gossypioides TaxID=34282 RepID=A0A7J9CWZ8_GOSGO|nr:hypothetical protein [Gossypium gossypioides]
MVGAQAVSLRVSADRSTFYNCRIIVFQNTLRDKRGNHFFNDCHIRGTWDVELINNRGRRFRNGGDYNTREREFIGGHELFVFLGRAWKKNPRVVYSYTKMDEIVHPGGWSHNHQPERAE